MYICIVCVCRLLLFFLSSLRFFLAFFSALMLFVEHLPFADHYLVIRSYRQLEKHEIHFYFHLKTLSFLWRVIYGDDGLCCLCYAFFFFLCYSWVSAVFNQSERHLLWNSLRIIFSTLIISIFTSKMNPRCS